MSGRLILSTEAMRAAEQRAVDGGTSVETLMERAGAALAESAFRFAGPMETLILCGPGNNGGDGYVAARYLSERGVSVRVAAVSEPKSDAAKWARSRWGGAVETLAADTAGAPLLIDALFGTGIKYGLDNTVTQQFIRLSEASIIRIDGDVPSGVESDSGAVQSEITVCVRTVESGVVMH